MVSSTNAPPLDIAPPKPWRRFIPLWLRSLIWVDSARNYDAFLSYSWKSDAKVAPVIQSLLQHFLCPWYRLRTKTVFRDLSCLPAGSSLEGELFDRLDRSTHLIVLASHEAAASHGMEIEARHWFSRPREGQVLIIVSSGDSTTWEEIRDHLLPLAIRNGLASEPLWIPLQHRREQILTTSKDHHLRGELIEDLKQVLLRLHPDRDWGQLRGEERSQRRRAITLLSAVTLLVLGLAIAALGFAWYAREQEALAHQQLVTTQVAVGQQLVDEGRLTEALPRFARALELDEGIPIQERLHRMRFGSHIRQSLVLLRIFLHSGVVQSAEFFGVNRLAVASTGEESIRLWDLNTGTAQSLHVSDQSSRVVISKNGLRAVLVGHRKGANYYEGKTGFQLWDTRSVAPVSAYIELPSDANAVALSIDGRFVAVGSSDHFVRVFDMATGSVQQLPHGAAVQHVSFNSDNNRLLTASWDKTLRVWDLSTGTDTVFEKGTSANFAAFSPDGHQVASTSGAIHNLDTGQSSVLEGATDIVKIAFSADGSRVVTCHGFYPVTGQGFARVWDVHTGKPISPPLVHQDYVSTAAFSPDGTLVITGSRDKTARLWNATSGVALTSPLPHAGDVRSVDFSENGELILTSSSDGSVRVWRAQVQSPVTMKAHGSLINLAFSPNGALVASSGFGEENGAPGSSGEVVVWKLADGRAVSPVLKHNSPVDRVRFSADGQYVITEDWNRIKRRWTTTGDLIDEGEASLLADTGDRLQVEDDRIVVKRPSGNISVIPEGSGHFPFISVDGRWVGVVSGKRVVRLWNALTGRSIRQELKSDFDIYGAAFIPGSTNVILLNATNKPSAIWRSNHENAIQTKSIQEWIFDSTGQRFAAIDYDARVGIWDLRTGSSQYLSSGGSPRTIAFSPTGAQLVVAYENNFAQVFDTKTARPVLTPLLHRAPVTSVEFSADEQLVATGSADGNVRVWEVESGLAISPPMKHSEGGQVVAQFTHGDTHVVSAGADSWIKVWDISPTSDSLSAIARSSQVLSGLLQDSSGRLTPLSSESLKNVLGSESTL